MSVPNQLHITTIKESSYKDAFHIASNTALYNAMKTLSISGLKLYLYFITNKHEYEFDLSPAHVKTCTDLSERSYYRAVAELKEHGYLVYAGKGLNYTFYETPSCHF